MVNWKFLLMAQYPAFLLLAVLFLIGYLRARKNSAIKSVLWVLLFGLALAAAVLFAFLGVHFGYWTLKTMFRFGLESWIGLVLVAAAAVAHVVHGIEKRHSQKLMEKKLRKAARERDDAVAQAEEAGREAARQAHEEGRREAVREVEDKRLERAASEADAEALDSELAREAQAPIELKLGE